MPSECGGEVGLFVIDMYFPTAGQIDPAEREELGKAWDEFCKAERKLRSVLGALGQSFKGGRDLARQIQSRRLNKTPFVFFTRKGNLIDAIEAYESTGALSVIKKPDPRDTVPEAQRLKACDKAMIDSADDIARELESAIRRNTLWYRYKALIGAFLVGVLSSALVGFLLSFFRIGS